MNATLVEIQEDYDRGNRYESIHSYMAIAGCSFRQADLALGGKAASPDTAPQEIVEAPQGATVSDREITRINIYVPADIFRVRAPFISISCPEGTTESVILVIYKDSEEAFIKHILELNGELALTPYEDRDEPYLAPVEEGA